MFPYYLSIGMSYELYWHGDPGLVRAYRKAEELRNEKRNQEMWMQGLYIYEALCDVSVLIPRFSKKKIKPEPYTEKPYPLKSKKKKSKKMDEEKALMEKARRKMDTFATKINAMFVNRKEVSKNG